RQHAGKLMQKATLELARLDLELRSRGSIDDADRHARMADPVAQLGREVPLDLLTAEILDARQDPLDQYFRARLGTERGPRRDPITRDALAQMHLPGAPVVRGGGQQQLFANRPETQQADAEFALQSGRAVRLQLPLDRIADMCGHVLKIGLAISVPAHALAVVFHAQVVLALFPAARDDDRLRMRVDAVF